jgi:hypothetical protein
MPIGLPTELELLNLAEDQQNFSASYTPYL